MSCGADCCESPTGRFFSKGSKKYAKQFRKGKLDDVQELLLESVRAGGVEGKSILDVGCGVGALHLTLLAEGAVSAVGIDMSEEMLSNARTFAEARKVEPMTTYIYGDIVEKKETVPPSDITFMDKVVCCYEGLPELLSATLEKTRQTLALSHPRDIWYTRWLFKVQIFASDLFHMSFKPWWHDWKRMEAMIEIEGMRLVKREETRMWTVLIYERG